ncbi:MAG TPA: 4-oxalocrotonate tautomerase family protein [Bacillota bacterium]|nr:4-oxalocrotonate tautomerase family protein [Clostridiales bacterium]HPT84652.1 4-oxalocrotonate tautomerase family protein [Bacillota bacterium]
MPVITIEILRQDVEKKKEIAKALTDELHRITGIPKQAITVVFHENSADNVSVGGELLSEKQKNS